MTRSSTTRWPIRQFLFNATRAVARALFTPASRAFPRMIEPLESRRLLTFVYEATDGDDVLVVTSNAIGGETTITPQGGTPVTTNQAVVIIEAKGGQDLVTVKNLFFDHSVLVKGGLGNDHLVVAQGHLGAHIDGTIELSENVNEGFDQVTILDNAGTSNHNDLHISAEGIYAEETLTVNATVYWVSNVESKQVHLNGGSDDVYMDGIPDGLYMYLSSGNNTLTYGGASRVMFGFVTPAIIDGGPDTDTMIFNDQNGGTTGRDYTATFNSVMNQTITSLDNLVINMRAASAGAPNVVQFTGTPAEDQITLNGSGVHNDISYGTAVSPVDLDAASVLLQVNARGPVSLYEQEDDPDVEPYYLYKTTSPAADRIDHGSFQGVFVDPSLNLSINGGTSNDVFNVAGQRTSSVVQINGGGGNDLVQTVNYGGNNHDNDLDEVFPMVNGGGSFTFRGGSGTDTFNLDDSADQTTDDDFGYLITGDTLRKGGPPAYPDQYHIVYDATTELFSVVASAENNTFTIGGHSTQSFTVNGGFGNDLFSTETIFGLQNCKATIGVIGGDGNDTIVVTDSDPLYTGVTEYRFDSNNFSYYTGLTRLGSIGFGGSTENFELYQGSAGTTTRVNVKATAFNLKVLAGAGNDSFHVGGGDFDSNQFTPLNTQLYGEGGIDSIRFDDRTDSVTAGESETLTLDSVRVTKGTKAISYNTFESQIVDAGNGTGAANTIELINVSSDMTSLTIYGGTVRPTIANIGAGGIVGLITTVNMNQVAGDVVNINDQNDTGNDTYILSATGANAGRLEKNAFVASQIIDFSGVPTLRFNSSNDATNMAVTGTPVGTVVFVNAGAGNDMIRLGNGNIDAQLLTTVVVDGGPGTDEVYFNNTQDNTFESQILDGLSFTDGLTHISTAVESMLIENGEGGGTFDLLRALVYSYFSSSSFNQTVNIGNGNLDANLLADVQIGVAGNVTVDDRLDTGNDGYIVNVTTFQKTTPGARTISMAGNVQAAILQANDGDNNIQVLQGLNNLHIFANGGNDHIDVADTVFIFTLNTINVHTGTENAPSPLFGDSIEVNSDAHIAGDVPASVRILGSDSVRSLNVRSAGKFQIPAGATVDLASPLALTLGGTIDLAGGAMIVRNFGSSINTVRNWAAAGYAGGAWNGTSASGAINSSLAAGSSAPDAVGYAKASEISSTFPFTWAGAQVNANDALMRYTYYGDADLNGVVNFDDYSRIDNGFINNRSGWVNGDFNYSNTIDFDDYALIDLAFNSPGRSARSADGVGTGS